MEEELNVQHSTSNVQLRIKEILNKENQLKNTSLKYRKVAPDALTSSGLTRRIEDGFLPPAFAGACFAGMTEAANFYREYIC